MVVSELEKLIEAAKYRTLDESEREEQRRSFAFGTANIENGRVTRALIDQEADALQKDSNDPRG
jgi:hypothetical protein